MALGLILCCWKCRDLAYYLALVARIYSKRRNVISELFTRGVQYFWKYQQVGVVLAFIFRWRIHVWLLYLLEAA